MKLVIMQPYLFPYIGYFQLIAAADKFVVYDDVNYIKQGWINRNRLSMAGKDLMFTVPVQGQSSFRLIKETPVQQFPKWRKKFLKTINQAYKKAPFFDHVLPMIEEVLEPETQYIGQLALRSLQSVCRYLEINTPMVESSSLYENNNLKAQQRVLDICKKENATHYINAMGGRELYDCESFRDQGIQLGFLQPDGDAIKYDQNTKDFIPWLSIIDVLMYNSPPQIRQFLTKFQVV